ncbi:MAG TPA: hemerythrin domain-containing protein [Albitalea sp.]
MLNIAWDAPLTNKTLGHPEIDETHDEFVQRVQAVQQAVGARDEAEVVRCFDLLVAHTEDHFAQEEGWMRATRCLSAEEHGRQHASVLQLLYRARTLARQRACWDALEAIIRELKGWFAEHEQLLDAELVEHIAQFSGQRVSRPVAPAS